MVWNPIHAQATRRSLFPVAADTPRPSATSSNDVPPSTFKAWLAQNKLLIQSAIHFRRTMYLTKSTRPANLYSGSM